MKAQFDALAAKFAALQRREQQLVAVTVLFVIGFGGYTFWIEPSELRAVALQKQISDEKATLQSLQAQLAVARAQLQDPDAPNKAALADVRTRLAAADQALHAYDNTLVPPDKMSELLQSLVTRQRGLQLLSLRTLAPEPLLAPAAKADGKNETKAPETKPAAPADTAGLNINRHGIEIRMAGSYPDLLAYVAALESLPQKLLWGKMSLAVTAYPRSELTLTVYTLSLDTTWLVV